MRGRGPDSALRGATRLTVTEVSVLLAAAGAVGLQLLRFWAACVCRDAVASGALPPWPARVAVLRPLGAAAIGLSLLVIIGALWLLRGQPRWLAGGLALLAALLGLVAV